MNEHPINLTVERVASMDEREMYNVSDAYVKNKLARFAVDPADQSLLKQREVPKGDRETSLADSADVFDAIKANIHDVLYDRRILPRHRFALDQMARSVQSQLDAHHADDEWRRSARGFLDLVKDELGRAEVVLEAQRETAATRLLDQLLKAVQAHRDAEDADEADDQLYLIADHVAAELDGSIGDVALSNA